MKTNDQYKVIINSYDHNLKSINFHPIQFNCGDLDSTEILKPFSEDFEETIQLLNKDKDKSTKHRKIKIDQENYYLSDNPVERLGFELNCSNDSFSFAKGMKSKPENEMNENNNFHDQNFKNGVSHSSTSDRLFQMSAILKEKKKLEIRENELKMLENCSFKPQINKKSSHLALTRSFRDLLRNQIIHKSTKTEIPTVFLNENQNDRDRVPKINKRSNEIVRNSHYSHSPIYQRLYNQNLQRKSKEKFAHETNEDEEKRKHQNKSKINRKTLQKAAEHFKREFESILNTMMINEGEFSKDFNAGQIEKILMNLGFLRGNQPKSGNSLSLSKTEENLLMKQMFSILNNNSKTPLNCLKASNQRLLRFLLCVLGIDPKKTIDIFEDFSLKRPEEKKVNNNLAGVLSKDDEKLQEIEENERNFKDFLEFSTEEDLCRYKTLETIKSLRDTNPNIQEIKDLLSPQLKILIDDNSILAKNEDFGLEMEEIHKRFQLFLRNRLMSQNEQTFKTHIESLSFTPNILRHSKEIATKAREKVRKSSPFLTSDLFGLYEVKKKAKINSLYVNKMEEITDSCPFKPEAGPFMKIQNQKMTEKGINSLKKLASPKFKIPEKKAEELEFEKAKKECTFKPNVLKSKATNSSQSKRPSFKFRKESKENQNIQNIQNNQKSNKLTKKPKEKEKEKIPLVIDVKLKEGQKEKIVIQKHSDLSEILKSFVSKHQLNAQQKTTLYEQIILQISCSNTN